MIRFSDLKIRNKLRVLSIFSFLSLILLGFVSNYFYNTGKTLSLIINAERVHNNTLQEGVEDYYRYLVKGDQHYLEQSVYKITLANSMARNFGEIDQLALLPKDEFVDRLFESYHLAYNEDRSNAVLMAGRIKLMLLFKPTKLVEAQLIALKGAELGEKILREIEKSQAVETSSQENVLNDDLDQMRSFYTEFANAVTELNSFANNLLYIGIVLIVICLIIIIAFISSFISKSIAIPVSEMVNKFGIIANKGNLNTELSIESGNEMGDLAHSFRRIQNGLREVIDHTKMIADGDYSVHLQPRSSEDEMSIALNKMVERLRESYENAQRDSWFKTGLNEINARLNSNQGLSELGDTAIGFLMDFLHSQLGSVYFFENEHKLLRLLSASGFDPKKLKKQVKLKEGLIGQVASLMNMQVVSEIPEDLYQTFSSSGNYHPKQIVLAPLVFNDSLIGVLELSSMKEYADIELDFLKEAANIIAIKLNSAESRIKTSELLQKTQDQASELQVQQEELRVANEELTEHTKVLTENEKKLQVQQEELRVANEELEERTRQLEMQKEDISRKNQELTEAQKMLELKARELQQASQYKSEFLANMSHELRTPLNSLLILSNLLSSNKKGNLTDDQVQSAKIIHKSGSDLLHLINEILDLSKIEAGKMSIEIEQVSVESLKEEVLMGFTALANDKNLLFEVNLDNSFPNFLSTDRYRLMQIVKNLLSNAFKFTSKGKVSVDFIPTAGSVKFRSANLTSQNTCCIKITDTGVGIPAEKLDSIFEAFQQADGSISRQFGGTGLGLSISRELIRLLSGEIQLESELGKGSSFYIYLPEKSVQHKAKEQVQESPAPAVEIEKPAVETKAKSPEFFIEDDRDETASGQSVLVIHPSKEQATMFLQQARNKNFQAIVASNITDGILLAELYHPKAVMLAVEYADSNDINYQKLRKHKLIGKLPVHIISAIDHDEQEHGELKTLETIEFSDALKSLDGYLSQSSRKLLIVEDNHLTRSVLRTMLAGLDLEIREAELAGEAFEILKNEAFDCIILDLGLPDFTGNELLEKLDSANISIPKVIVYTGKDMTKNEVKQLGDYTDTIILKGIKSDERLMDEVTLFLHQVSKQIPELKAKNNIVNDNSVFKGKKILIVDDDIRNIFALGQMLEEREMEVIEAENGKVAIEMLQENKNIDLVLMDVMMPVMDGYEAMRIIRNTPDVKDIPIICLTAKAMKEDHENALKNGANDYLSKPLDEHKLFSMLKIWLYKN